MLPFGGKGAAEDMRTFILGWIAGHISMVQNYRYASIYWILAPVVCTANMSLIEIDPCGAEGGQVWLVATGSAS